MLTAYARGEELCNAVCDTICIFLGAAYSRAEAEVRSLVISNNLPFLPTPMGKGLLPDDHDLCVAAARSKYVDMYLLGLLYTRVRVECTRRAKQRTIHGRIL